MFFGMYDPSIVQYSIPIKRWKGSLLEKRSVHQILYFNGLFLSKQKGTIVFIDDV